MDSKEFACDTASQIIGMILDQSAEVMGASCGFSASATTGKLKMMKVGNGKLNDNRLVNCNGPDGVIGVFNMRKCNELCRNRGGTCGK